MSDETKVDSEPQTERRPRGKRNRKSDGLAGVPFIAQPSEPAVTGQNASLKEPPPKPGEGVDPNHPCAAHVQILDREKALVLSTRKKFAICGFASSSRHMIPINNAEWEIWGMNQLYRHVARADRWFDMHWNWDQELVPGTDHAGWIRECGIPVYMIKAHADMPTTVRFPIDTLISEYTDYYTSSVAEMVALAIWEIDMRVMADLKTLPPMPPLSAVRKMRELYAEYSIGLFGIDLIVGEEYFWQKTCAEFWVGAAAVGRGIQVYIPPQSALCKQRFRYGYETEPPTILKPAELSKHQKQLQEERDKMLRQAYMLDGAIQTDEYWNELLELRLRGGDIKVG